MTMLYDPNKPMMPLLKEITEEANFALRRIDSNDWRHVASAQRDLLNNVIWLLGKLLEEHDAALDKSNVK